jgi:hypothetical protein
VFIFGATSPVTVQGAVFAGIAITEGWTTHPREAVYSDWVRVDPARKLIEVLRRKDRDPPSCRRYAAIR